MSESELRMTFEMADEAGAWGFNCGPGALCGVLNMTPDELRPHLGDFEQKGHMNPTLMFDTLNRLGVQYRKAYRSDETRNLDEAKMEFGLVRIQWGGPWTKPGVPMAARYCHTHWIGVRNFGVEVFDVNAMCVGGWLPQWEWRGRLVPWLLQDLKKWDGLCWPTHGIEVTPGVAIGPDRAVALTSTGRASQATGPGVAAIGPTFQATGSDRPPAGKSAR